MTTSIYGPPGFEGMGYSIESSVLGWRWRWIEPGEEDELGEFKPTRAEALRDAAHNWDENGGVLCNLSSTLRGLATKEED